jgi:predicted NUDIX family NTP pyrophosphohydrolase
MPTSAGILVYKKMNNQFYFLLAHPGGPFYKNKDEGSWGIPKGLLEKEEAPFYAARREFFEETSLALPEGEFIPLPTVKYKNGKTLLSWAIQVDDLDLSGFKSNTFEARWSTQSTQLKTFDEIDALVFFELTIAQQKIHPVQLPLIDFITRV